MFEITGTSLGMLERLPLEIRQKVYEQLFSNLIIHCCSHIHEPLTNGHSQHKTTRSHLTDFHLQSLDCSVTDTYALINQHNWHASIFGGSHAFQRSDILALFLTSKAVWLESEPVLWQTATFSMGLLQFSTFHKRFLEPLRDLRELRVSRGRFLRRIHISIPSMDKTALRLSMNHLYRPWTTNEWLNQSLRESVHRLSQCKGLRYLSIAIDTRSATSMHTFLLEFFEHVVWKMKYLHSASVYREVTDEVTDERLLLGSENIDQQDHELDDRTSYASFLSMALEDVVNHRQPPHLHAEHFVVNPSQRDVDADVLAFRRKIATSAGKVLG